MFDIVAVGELLIDFTPKKFGEESAFVPNPGGAPCNFLTMASHLGAKTAFIGKVGNDAFGKQLKGVIDAEGVDTRNLILSDEVNTTLAFVHLDPSGDRSFSFYRKGCADVNLKNDEVDYDIIDGAKAVHFGSLSFTDEPSRTTVHEILSFAKDKGKIISYDPNFRPALWESEEEAIKHMLSGFDYANVIKVSDEEAILLTGENDFEKACEKLMTDSTKLICVTLGGEGVYYYHKDGSGIVPGFKSNVVDTTGAGDTFFGATIGQLILKEIDLDHIDNDKLEELLKFSNAAASICIEGYGGIPSIPSVESVNERV